jgi:hypothetical protein
MERWNHAFSGLIRQTRPEYWGNWGLNMQIKPGAVGVVDSNSGDFRLVADDALPGMKLDDMKTSSTWALMSENISRSESSVELEGSFTDPESGTKVTAGLKVEWGMAKAWSLVSEFAVGQETVINSYGTLINQNFDSLAKLAESVQMGENGNIAQGFGVITSVIYANSGLNVGSLSDSSTFSIAGSVSGVNELVGKASGKGSYANTSMSKSMDLHIWPEKSGTLAPVSIPIAYTFASFDGKLLIPNWITQLGSLELYMINKVGCTYITNVALKYDTPSGTKSENIQISGGLTKTFGNIPLYATNITVDITFIGIINDDHYHLHWDKPLGQWLNGQRHIEMSGVWPGQTQCIDLEA